MVATAPTLACPDRIARPRLSASQLFSTALQAFSTRRLRAALSALGIAIGIGIGAMVAVVNVSASAQANLIAEIDALGTNLLTVTPGQTILGANAVLPATSVPMIGHMQNVLSDAADYQVKSASVYRNPFVPAAQTGGIGVDAAGENLPGSDVVQVRRPFPALERHRSQS
jgi:putative ABC transport system permease protein